MITEEGVDKGFLDADCKELPVPQVNELQSGSLAHGILDFEYTGANVIFDLQLHLVTLMIHKYVGVRKLAAKPILLEVERGQLF